MMHDGRAGVAQSIAPETPLGACGFKARKPNSITQHQKAGLSMDVINNLCAFVEDAQH
jgi:hypothetical protein